MKYFKILGLTCRTTLEAQEKLMSKLKKDWRRSWEVDDLWTCLACPLPSFLERSRGKRRVEREREREREKEREKNDTSSYSTMSFFSFLPIHSMCTYNSYVATDWLTDGVCDYVCEKKLGSGGQEQSSDNKSFWPRFAQQKKRKLAT